MQAKTDIQPVSITILSPKGSMESALLGIVDIFNLLNRFSNKTYFNVNVLNPTKDKAAINTDYLIVPPILDDPFSKRTEVINQLKLINLKKTVVCSVCSGSFQLAYADIVGTRKITTHWGYKKEFKELFPAIKLDINEMVIEDNSIISAAGIMAYIDLCLYIIKRSLSPLAAQRCARIILFNGQRSKQSPYIDSSLVKTRNDQENELLEFIETNLAKELTIKAMAQLLGMHERTFLRWFKIHFKTTPLKFINNFRLDRAKSLLQISKLTVNEICYEIGYLDPSSFRRNFKRATGLSPSEFRNSL